MANIARAKPATLSPKLWSFCKRLGIARYVPTALRIIRESFPRATNMKMFAEMDPETGEEWLAIEIIVRGNREEIRRQYHSYTDRKIALIPRPQRDAIRLSHWYRSQ